MSGTKEKKAFVHERGAAWIVTLLLSAFISVTVLGTLLVQVLTSAGLHIGTAQDDGLLNRQMEHIYESIDKYAEEYGFSAESVKTVITREEIRELNRRSAEWWTGLLTEGKADAVPRWYSEEMTEAVSSTMVTENRKEDPQIIASDLTEIVERTVFPLRGTLMSKGMDLVNNQADVPGVIRALRKLPLFGLALCVLTAGVLVLLLGREIVRSLKHFGTALAGAGFILIFVIVILLSVGLKGMLAEASEGLAGEFGTMTGKIGLEAAGIIVLLLATGYFCLFMYRRKAGRDPETEQVQ